MDAKKPPKRVWLVDLAQVTADSLPRTYRAVVIVTDEAGDFVGVGMNTSLDDAINIMRCALSADGIVFHGTHTRRASSAHGGTKTGE